MCGRMNVIEAPITAYLREQLGLDFHTQTNRDLRPTQRVDTVMLDTHAKLQQITTRWGIQPAWSKKILINAQVETAAEKRTFKRAWQQSRCLIPVSGWYEWRQKESGKQKYLFKNTDDQEPLFMGGIVFQDGDTPQLVSFTTQPTPRCAEYHHRMPLLIPNDAIRGWLSNTEQALQIAQTPFPEEKLTIECSK